jgi:hypothetical protein
MVVEKRGSEFAVGIVENAVDCRIVAACAGVRWGI